MVERPLLPIRTVVTGRAIGGRAQTPGVMLILVTRGAGRALCREGLIRVATDTCQRRVLAQQGEAGKVMVKPHALPSISRHHGTCRNRGRGVLYARRPWHGNRRTPSAA